MRYPLFPIFPSVHPVGCGGAPLPAAIVKQMRIRQWYQKGGEKTEKRPGKGRTAEKTACDLPNHAVQ